MARQKAKAPTVLKVGLDIGYGLTKVITDNDQMFIFPSTYGDSVQLRFQKDSILARYPGDVVNHKGREYFIGNLAQAQLQEGLQLKLRGRSADPHAEFRVRLIFALAAIGKLFEGVYTGDNEVYQVEIATGLPVRHLEDNDIFKQMLTGQHRIRTNSCDILINVINVYVMPQPYGTFYTEFLNPDGALNECYTARKTGMVDIGTYSVDLAVDEDGDYIDRLSTSNESGVYSAHERLAPAIESIIREKPTVKLVDEVLRCKCLTSAGKDYDMSEYVDDALRPLIESVLIILQNTWQAAGLFHNILVAGGGAEFVIDAIRNIYPHARIVDNPKTSNAEGYLRYLKYQDEE